MHHPEILDIELDVMDKWDLGIFYLRNSVSVFHMWEEESACYLVTSRVVVIGAAYQIFLAFLLLGL